MRKHATPIQPPAADLRFLSDGEHYEEVVERMRSVKKTLWVGTAVREFDAVWMGRHCQSCRRRAFCNAPILSIMHEKIFDNITP